MRNNLLFSLVIVVALAIFGYFLVTTNNELRKVEERLQTVSGTEAPPSPRQVLDEARGAVDLAFNLLGLFEALSLAVTIGGVVLVYGGLTGFNSARNELTETRQLVEQELERYRERFESEIQAREQELTTLRTELETTSSRERQTTANALLANALIPLAERQYKAADYKGAMYTYHRALELDPKNPVVNQRLAYVHTQMGDLEQAKHHYEKAIEAEPDFAPALAGLGFVQRRFAERLEKTMMDGTLPDDERLQKRIERDQLLNRSEDLLLHALKLSPKLVDDDNESWWGILGGLYKRRGQISQAIEAYYQATQVTPQSSYGYVNLAQLYMKQGKWDKMLETFEHVEQIASREADASEGNFWGYSDLIVSSYAIGKHDQARRALPIAISIAPIDSPFMLEGLVETLREVVEHVADYNRPPIYEAIELLAAEMERRAEQARLAAKIATSEVDVILEPQDGSGEESDT